jgi:hypothetical protein
MPWKTDINITVPVIHAFHFYAQSNFFILIFMMTITGHAFNHFSDPPEIFAPLTCVQKFYTYEKMHICYEQMHCSQPVRMGTGLAGAD